MEDRNPTIRKFISESKGFTLVELILAMAVMSILVGMFYSLFFTGGKTYTYIYDNYKVQNEARIAMSFMTVKIRQNDRIVTGSHEGVDFERNAVHLVKIVSPPDPDKVYMQVDVPVGVLLFPTYIYFHNGLLMETNDESELFTESGTVIADNLDSIDFSYPVDADGTEIKDRIIIEISYNSSKNTLEETIALRAVP